MKTRTGMAKMWTQSDAGVPTDDRPVLVAEKLPGGIVYWMASWDETESVWRVAQGGEDSDTVIWRQGDVQLLWRDIPPVPEGVARDAWGE